MDYPRIQQIRRVRRAESTPSRLSEPKKYELREDERPVSSIENSQDYKETDMRWKWAGSGGDGDEKAEEWFNECVDRYGYDSVR